MKKSFVFAFAIVIASLGGVAAGKAVTGGAPIPPAADGDLPNEEIPVEGSETLEQTRVADPHGGPPWGIRVFRGRGGDPCRAVGRVVHGELVVLQTGGTHRKLPLRGPGVCSDLSQTPATFSLRQDRSVPDGKARSVLSGLVREDVESITVTGAGEARTLTPSPRRSYLTVYDEFVDLHDFTITVTFGNGERKVL